MSYLWISLALGTAAGLANLLGGGIVAAWPWRRSVLTSFIAFGSGFMLATTITVMIPESFERLQGARAAPWILVGYFIVHVFEHSLPAHFHFAVGEAAPPASTEANAKPAPVPRGAKPIYVETGLASWYGPPYHHHRGANGETYDQNSLTAAHRTLPMNSVVRVTNQTTGHAVVVRITDRGPLRCRRPHYRPVAGGGQAVDVWRPGTAEVKVEVLSAPAPIAEGGRWCVQIGAFQSSAKPAN